MRTLLAYGDSNTHGTLPMTETTDRARLGPEARWPGVAAAALAPAWRVVEEGLPGRTVARDDPTAEANRNGLALLPAVLESHAPVDLLVIMLGTNDLKAVFAATPQDIADTLNRMLQSLRASLSGPGGTPPRALLVAPPPITEVGWIGEAFAGGAAKSRRLAPLLRDVAERKGAGFLDLAAHVAVSPIDGIHYDAEGHRAIGHAVAETTRRMMG